MPSPTSELKNSIVRAGAGAGKTRGLVEKIVEVYRQFQKQKEVPRIVLTTFTRKATQELKERLILKACQERDPGLLQFVSDPSHLQISTIHGILNIFLRQVGHLAGLDAGFQIVSETEALHLSRLSLREVVVENPEALSWLEIYGFERLLKMCRRFEEGTREHGHLRPPQLTELQVLAAEESDKWKGWLNELAGEICGGVNEAQWQAFGQSLKGFLETWSGDSAELKDLPSKPRRSKKQAEFEPWHERTEEAIKEFKKAMGRECWNQTLWPNMVLNWQNFAQIGEDFVQRLSRLKDQQARFQMSDLELKTMEILRLKPFLGAIFAENWDFWMIDEYQDTSPLQVACLKALIGDRKVYRVGDPQQSIYLFRGAEVRVFSEAESEVVTQGGEAHLLKKNYRSEPELLLFMNDFMTGLSSQFQAMEPRTNELNTAHPQVCATLIKVNESDDELKALVGQVHQLVEQGAALEKICILGRTHRTLMEVSRALKEFGYPTHLHSSRGFSTRREVVDAQALWKFLVNPHDNHNLMILLRSPWFFNEDFQLVEWMKNRPQSLWQRLQSLEGEVPEAILRLKHSQSRLKDCGLVKTFEETLISSGILDLSLNNDPAGRKESNLWKLILKARSLETEGGVSALDFLNAGEGSDPLDASEGDATSAQEPNCINLMTIHGSKGLEFDHVLIPRMGEAPRTSVTLPLEVDEKRFFFPVWNEAEGEFQASPLDYLSVRRKSLRELEEFDRWLYVALTRAKTSLTLTSNAQPQKESWAERSSFFQKPPGLYKTDFYTYEVRLEDQLEAPRRYVSSTSIAAEVRPLFLDQALEKPLEPQRTAVTDLIQSERSTGDWLRRLKAQSLGTKIHRALEATKYGHHSSAFEKPVEFVLSLKEPPMQALIRDGFTEWGFQVQDGDRVIEGQIDLWGIHNGRIYVVDYKTGSRKGEEDAFLQLRLYAWALRRFQNKEPMELVVIYPLSEKVSSRPYTDQGS